MILRGFVEQVRDQADIVRIISDYVSLKKRGANYLALCPFHHEKTPSFAVHPGKQIFKCFGCSVGGDVFKFIMQIEGCSWAEAVRIVAEKSGIPIPQSVPEEQIKEDRARAQWRERLSQINHLASEFFQRCLAERQGKEARSYLEDRGLRGEAIRRLRIGYAPPGWDSLLSFLASRRIGREEIVRSGLVVLREDGSGYYDRFRNRIIFPIMDGRGRIVAFGGRALGDEEPKYVNSPETALYSKGRHLFGLYHAREAIRRAGFAILVEGYFDFATPFQQGVENIVATLGTALTDDQVRLLRRNTGRVVVNFDPDPAGRSAMMRSVEMLIRGGLETSILALPEGCDPDSFVRTRGASEYARLARESQSYIDFVIAQALEGKDASAPAVKARALREIAPYISLMPDKIERIATSDYVANRLRLDPHLVRDEIVRLAQEGTKPSKVARDAAEPPSADRPSLTPAERRLLEIALNREDVRGHILSEIVLEDLKGAASRNVFESLLRIGPSQVNYPTLAEHLERDEFSLDIVERALMSEVRGTADELLAEARACLQSLRRRRLQQELGDLQAEIENAREQNESEKLSQLLLRKAELARSLTKNFSSQGC